MKGGWRFKRQDTACKPWTQVFKDEWCYKWLIFKWPAVESTGIRIPCSMAWRFAMPYCTKPAGLNASPTHPFVWPFLMVCLAAQHPIWPAGFGWIYLCSMVMPLVGFYANITANFAKPCRKCILVVRRLLSRQPSCLMANVMFAMSVTAGLTALTLRACGNKSAMTTRY